MFEAMDTPDKNQTQKQGQNQIGTPRSKFEDSPVFNYLSNLSPIPIKSSLITQPLTSLNIASLPSIFASPHITSQRESRFLTRHESPDPSKPEFTTESGHRACSNEGGSAQQPNNSAELQNNFVLSISTREGSAETPGKSAIELTKTSRYVSGSPDFNPKSCRKIETNSTLELVGPSTSLVHIGHEASEKGPEGNLHLQEMCQTLKKNQGAYEWDNFISDAGDLMIFNSPGDSETLRGLLQTPNSGTSFMASVLSEHPLNNVDDMQKKISVDLAGSSEQHQTEDHLLQPQESAELQPVEPMHENLVRSDSYKSMDNELDSYAHRGIRRRCLDFEMIGGCKNLNVSSSSSALRQSDEEVTPKDKQLVVVKPGADCSRYILSGIGLHLNAITTSSNNFTNMNSEVPNTASSLSSAKAGQESLAESLTSTSFEGGIDVADNGGQLVHDASQASQYSANNEVSPNSPKKKRRKAEQEGEPGACKRCNCKKSKCLKLYCECFAAGVYCIEPCSCQDCLNKPIHESTVLATRKVIETRNPLAFTPKVIRNSDAASDNGDDSNKTPASARHKRGCNCKKSSCLKKYCECYQGGVGCSINCRCENCKNAFGRKDGSAVIGVEVETEMERETHKTVLDKSSQSIEVQDGEEQIPTFAVPAKPSQICRPLVQLPFPSNSKPPRSTSFLIGSSSGLYTSQTIGKPNILRPQAKFENQLETVPEDTMPDILCENQSPSKNVKTSSPNGKRVAPPNCDLGSSPPRRSGRKLILQSIPSFPSLNSQH